MCPTEHARRRGAHPYAVADKAGLFREGAKQILMRQARRKSMSASDPGAELMHRSKTTLSFDHGIGECEQRRRHIEAKRPLRS